MSEFNSSLLHVRFVVDQVAMGQVFIQVFQFSPVRIILPVLHIHAIYYQCHLNITTKSVVQSVKGKDKG
jgi:hypothetical protein